MPSSPPGLVPSPSPGCMLSPSPAGAGPSVLSAVGSPFLGGELMVCPYVGRSKPFNSKPRIVNPLPGRTLYVSRKRGSNQEQDVPRPTSICPPPRQLPPVVIMYTHMLAGHEGNSMSRGREMFDDPTRPRD